MSAEQDSVQRLARLRAREVITSHPLPLEVVGAVDVLCSLIDSFTAERDQLEALVAKAAAAAKTECLRGHSLLDEANLTEHSKKRGVRMCLTCQRMYRLRSYRRRNGANLTEATR